MNYRSVLVILSLVIFLSAPKVNSAEDLATDFSYSKSVSRSVQEPTEANGFSKIVQFRSTQESTKLYVCGILSSFAFLSLVVILWFITRSSYSTFHIVNASALVLIIFGAIFIVVLADTEQQLTASTGILGAIAGYLFGTMRRREEGPEKPRPDRVEV